MIAQKSCDWTIRFMDHIMTDYQRHSWYALVESLRPESELLALSMTYEEPGEPGLLHVTIKCALHHKHEFAIDTDGELLVCD